MDMEEFILSVFAYGTILAIVVAVILVIYFYITHLNKTIKYLSIKDKYLEVVLNNISAQNQIIFIEDYEVFSNKEKKYVMSFESHRQEIKKLMIAENQTFGRKLE